MSDQSCFMEKNDSRNLMTLCLHLDTKIFLSSCDSLFCSLNFNVFTCTIYRINPRVNNQYLNLLQRVGGGGGRGEGSGGGGVEGGGSFLSA
jgi:hypothetical protein